MHLNVALECRGCLKDARVRVKSKIAAACRVRSMKVAIGLPATIPGTEPELVLEWAKLADAKGFSSLGIIDRLVYPNLEPIVSLAAAASITERIRLMTTILLAPLRNTSVLAKQAATLDRISRGRFTLGLAIGGREDDSLGAGVIHNTRARRLEEQLKIMRRIWLGEPTGERAGKIGPPPIRSGGPELLIGGYSPPAAARAGRLGDGFIAGGGVDPKSAADLFRMAEESWKAAGRAGKPRLVCCGYFALGPDSAARGAVYIRDYYGFMGPRVENVVKGILSTRSAVENALKGFSEIGADEFVLWPTIPEIEQVELAAELMQ
jgi:alkanesulfonate monooxygenase SsuD/methylene tetrahydromethanopterin reductase-like flavin-dependent oxidoreductase (luciferase family)